MNIQEAECQVSVVEAVPLDQLDENAAKDNLKQATEDLARAQNDEERAVHQIGVEVNSAIIAALGMHFYTMHHLTSFLGK